MASMGRPCLGSLLWALIALAHFTVDAARIGFLQDDLIAMPSEDSPFQTSDEDSDESAIGTRWAVLLAGSGGYWNYRHQADVCHAYQLLKRGGLKDENIVVFMYDDIAHNTENPRYGEIINSPEGEDVYAGVPKDYTRRDVNANNFFAVILGNKTALTGEGSGKVVDSGPNDHIFIFYTDHGGPGVLGMPTGDFLYADQFNEVLLKKHAASSYKEMVIYVEACESGSIFEGLLPDDLNIYVTTASSAYESSWGTYCPGMSPSPPPEFTTCLGDLYSVAWMEDSEVHNLKRENLQEQYDTVKTRTSNQNTYTQGSHVMQYGDVNNMTTEKLYIYLGSDPANENLTSSNENGLEHLTAAYPSGLRQFLEGKEATGVNQRDADMIYFWQKYTMANEGSAEKLAAQQTMVDMLARRLQLDKSVELIGKLLFGYEQGPAVLKATREPGQALVDDWDCLKTMVSTFESHCGSLSDYGMKHMRALANICNAGVDGSGMAVASAEACAIFRQSSN